MGFKVAVYVKLQLASIFIAEHSRTFCAVAWQLQSIQSAAKSFLNSEETGTDVEETLKMVSARISW